MEMYYIKLYFIILLVSVSLLWFPQVSESAETKKNAWFLDKINTPSSIKSSGKKKIVVAIVDDGIRTTHSELRNLIWQNPFETSDNYIDDDGNGSIDDIN